MCCILARARAGLMCSRLSTEKKCSREPSSLATKNILSVRMGLSEALSEYERADVTDPQHGGRHMEPSKQQMMQLADVHQER